MRKKNPQHYVDKNEMMEELIKYNETEIISEELGLMFYKIAEHYGSQPKFAGYSCIEEMKSSAGAGMQTRRFWSKKRVAKITDLYALRI